MSVINHKEIQPSTNWVLVRPTEIMEKYHLDGKETSIFVGHSAMKYLDPHDSLDFEQAESVDTHAHHWPITGEVIAVPKNNVFYGHEIKKIMELPADVITPEDIQKANRLKDASSRFRSEVEVSVGDQVVFDYMMNIKCYEEGLVFKTDIGDLFLILHDDIDINLSTGDFKPLNGNILFEWIQDTGKGKINLLEKEIQDATGIQKGVVTHVGTDPRFYIEGLQLIDMPSDIQVGDVIYFQPYECSMLESKLHLSIFGGKEIYTIKRHNILFKEVPKEE